MPSGAIAADRKRLREWRFNAGFAARIALEGRAFRPPGQVRRTAGSRVAFRHRIEPQGEIVFDHGVRARDVRSRGHAVPVLRETP